MAGYRIIQPKLTIDGDDFKCLSKTAELVPGERINFCENEWTVTLEVELSYAATTGSWNLLNALRDTVVEIVIAPADAVAAATNPTATFDARIPPIPLMMGAEYGSRMTFSLELTSEGEPVFGVGA